MKTRVYVAQGCLAPQVGDEYNGYVVTKVEALGLVGDPHPHVGWEEEFELTLENLRPCQCGSGEPWTTCGENTSYCG